MAWWSQRMVELLPTRLRAPSAELRDALLVDAPHPAQGFSIAVRSKRRTSALGSFALGDSAAAGAVVARRRRMADVVLRLPAALLLEREVTLPAAAEQDLESVLGYEMDRVTPFTAAEVFWSASVQRRDRARGQIGVRLSLVAKQALGPLLDSLAAAGIAPTAIEAGGGAAPRLIVVHKRAARGRRLRRALNVMAGGLAVAALVLPFVRTELAIHDTNRRIDALRPAVMQAETLRRALAADTTSADAIATEQARLGNALQALAAVTDILPDDTFLTEFGLRQRRVTMAGQSATAARLIGLLSDDPLIRNPAFTAPVTRSETGRADLFVLRAELGTLMAASFANLPTGRRGQAMALGVTLILLVILWTGVVSPLIDLYAARQETLGQRRALLARMTMLADMLPALSRQAGEKANAGPAPQALIEGASDAVASAVLQERIQQMASQSGANLASVEALPGEPAKQLRRIGLRLTLTTSWPVLVHLLAAIDAASPRMLVDELQLEGSVIQVRQGEARLEARLNVYAFRAGTEPAP